MGYQECFIYIRSQRKMKKIINYIEKNGYNDFHIKLSIVTIKNDIGIFRKKDKVLMIYGDRMHSVREAFNIMDINIEFFWKFEFIPIEMKPYYDIFLNGEESEYYDIKDIDRLGEYTDFEVNEARTCVLEIINSSDIIKDELTMDYNEDYKELEGSDNNE